MSVDKTVFLCCLISYMWFSCGRDRDGHDLLMLERSSFFLPRFFLLLALLQVFIGIVEEFEEVRGFGGGECGCSGIVLVGVILAR